MEKFNLLNKHKEEVTRCLKAVWKGKEMAVIKNLN